MKRTGKGCFWTVAAILIVAAVCLSPGRVQADWTYEYRDDFSANQAEADSYFHSIFWPQGAFPPSQEAYLYNLDSGELGFGDYNDDPAYLGYYFPSGSENSPGAVYGELLIDVRFPESSGYLFCSLSADAITTTQELEPGTNRITIESVWGRCYVVFYGSEVLIDNLEVHLDSPSATIGVPRDFATIQEAIDSAVDGDIVEVSSGTYSGEGNCDIDFGGKAITVRSEDGPGWTTIDCGGQGHRGFYFHSGEEPSSVLRGFTIVGGSVPGSDIPSDEMNWNSSPTHPIGGGIYCELSSPSIIDCVIKQCSAELGAGIGSVGAGIGSVAGGPEIIDCVVEQCQAGGLGSAGSGGLGAGIGLIRGSSATIVNCTIEENVGYFDSLGAGVYCWQSEALLTNCNISSNSAQGNIKGGGIYCGGGATRVVLKQCIVSNNAAEAGGGVFGSSVGYMSLTNCTIAHNRLSGGIYSVGGDVAIRNSIVWHNDGAAVMLLNPATNDPVLYSNIEGGFSGQGNIDTPPLFASGQAGDYHLQSVYGRYDTYRDKWVIDYDHSPCIDAGDPQDPVGSEPFPNSKRINMGAYGGTHEASKSKGPLIFHVDGTNGGDFNTGLSRSDAFATIQKAVDETIDGDIVMVWPGLYQEEVVFDRKRIIVQSADDAATIVAPAGYAFSFYGAESSSSVLRNFVVTGCGVAAIFCHSAWPELINLTLADNQFGITGYGGANPLITNCILWNNRDGDLFSEGFQLRASYSCLQKLRALDEDHGNISTDPLFADPDNGDYHLKSRFGRYSPEDGIWVDDLVNSPCIDTGDPSMHRGREPHGGRVNMGAYGGTPFASKGGPSW